ncbi:Levanase [Paenibacillus polymyxa E681]|uniref:GH32 C-terminal domain-containing protein n=1 Tax=Paenibacillus polymyxa TaxID=1406 RepID=UPI0001E3109F|nr:GH32 C-terminal domain-containing protein [Paenibacillus polymyxa]QNV55833.1 Levanase [Paenibacillus polymyxa E681]QNV60669.1 Levanase [Paenibacillus polymyxa E681]
MGGIAGISRTGDARRLCFRKQEVYVDRTRSGCSDFHEDFAGRHAVPLETAENRLDLHIYVDRSSIEVFFNHGQVVITDLIFPDAESKDFVVEAQC